MHVSPLETQALSLDDARRINGAPDPVVPLAAAANRAGPSGQGGGAVLRVGRIDAAADILQRVDVVLVDGAHGGLHVEAREHLAAGIEDELAPGVDGAPDVHEHAGAVAARLHEDAVVQTVADSEADFVDGEPRHGAVTGCPFRRCEKGGRRIVSNLAGWTWCLRCFPKLVDTREPARGEGNMYIHIYIEAFSLPDAVESDTERKRAKREDQIQPGVGCC